MKSKYKTFSQSFIGYGLTLLAISSCAVFDITSTTFNEVMGWFVTMIVLQIISFVAVKNDYCLTFNPVEIPFWSGMLLTFYVSYIAHELRHVMFLSVLWGFSFLLGVASFKYLIATASFCVALYLIGVFVLSYFAIETVALSVEIIAVLIIYAILITLCMTGLRILKQKKKIQRISEEIQNKKEQLEVLASKLAKYLSPQIYESIFFGEKDAKIETYRKTLTIFFSDIVGFTNKTENTPVDELTEWLNDYLDRMAEIAIRYNGTIDKFIGDSVMAFFGDPQSKGEQLDAVQCVFMALAMQDQAQQMGMSIRIGIHTGDCIVGNFGSEQHMEYTIIGGAVNLAARLETNSKPGAILISDTTYELIKGIIHCEKRGVIRVKGIDRDVMTYWAIDHQK